MKALPITHKTKRSPLKQADAFLVNNDAQIHAKFVDVRKAFADGRAEGKSQTKVKEPQREEEKKTTTTDPSKGTSTVTVPLTK